jgi:predicted DNA-binding protein (MmcQ/YjbR family)
MDIEWVRDFCLSLPHTTEHVQWEIDLVFKVGGKMYAVVPTEPARVWISLKAEDDEFAELIERQAVIPAPYLARAKWIAIESEDALPRDEVERLLRKAYAAVFAKLPKRAQAKLMANAVVNHGARGNPRRTDRKRGGARKGKSG